MSRPILLPTDRQAQCSDASAPLDQPTTVQELRAALPSWLTSLVFHLTLVLILACVQIAGDGLWHQQGIALDVQTVDSQAGGGVEELIAGMSASADFSSPAVDQRLTQPEKLVANDTKLVADVELEDFSRAIAPPVSAGGAGDTDRALGMSDGDDADGASGGAGGLGPASTGVFGLVSEGTKFVYVFDHSESMNSRFAYTSENTTVYSLSPLEAAKAELLKSLEDLDRKQQFQILFYNQQPWLFDLGKNWRRLIVATPRNKQRACDFVTNVYGEGNTKHMPPLEIALRLKPDVIFLLTDGEAKDDPTYDQLRSVRQLNGGTTRINVIQFCHVPRKDSTLLQLARENGGKHVFMNIAELAPAMAMGR